MLERQNVGLAELKAALRHRRGEDSGSGDDDPGLPRSPPTSPTTLDVLNHGLKGSSRATQSSCSDGSLLSMGSSENDEDSLGAASHHSSRASLLEGRHQVVGERKKPIIVAMKKKEEIKKEEEEEEEAKTERKKKTKARLREEEDEGGEKKKEEKTEQQEKQREKMKEKKEEERINRKKKEDVEEKKIDRNKGEEEEEEEKKDDDAGKRKGKSRLRRKRGDVTRLTFVSDTIIVGRDHDLTYDDDEDGSDHEPVVGAVRLSHQAALHKIAVRPRRTHGAPRARRATQIGITGQISLPDVIEEANSRHHISGQRPAPPQAAPTSPAPAPAAPTTPPTTSTPPTPDDDEVMEDAVVTREPQQQQQGSGGGEAAAERKEERRDEPLFQRLFGSSSKRSGRRQSRGSGEESRENSVSPLRRGTDQRAPRFPILSSGSSKPRQEATTSHPLPPSGRPRELSRERGVREPPQASHSPEEAPVSSGGPGVHRGQGVRKAKSFREEQTVVQREALRRKVSPHAGAEGRGGAGPGKVARLSSSLENLDNDEMNRTTPPHATVAPAAPPTASPQRSSTESLAMTPIPGVFIRPHPQTSRHRGPTHPSTPEHTSGPFSLDSSLPQQPRETEEHLRKASSVDQVSYDGLSHTTQSHREQVVKEQHILKDHSREQHIRELYKEQHIKEQVVVMKEQHVMREQQHHYKEEQITTSRHLHQHHITTTTPIKPTETKPTAGPTPPTPAAKQSLLDTLVESIRPDRKQDTPKHTHRKSLPQTHTSQIPPQPSPPQTQVFQKEEASPAAPSAPQPEAGEGDREQAAPRRPVRREASMKRIPSITGDANTAGVPEFMRIQLNRVESKGQSVIYDTDQERVDRRDSDVAPRRESIPSALSPPAPLADLPKDMPPSDPPAETHTPLRRESVTPSPAASTRDSLTRRASMQGPRGVIRDTSPSAVADVGGGGDMASEPPSQESTVERVQLRRPGVAERTSHASSTSSSTSTTSSTASTSRDQPELFKVFARRSFKIKDSEKELFEAASLEEVGVEASSEVSEMTVSSVRPPSTSPGPAVSPIPPTEPTPSAQKIGINAISFNRKSVGNPALSFIPPPTPAPSEPPAGPQGHGRPQASPSTASTTTRSPSITTTTTTITTTTETTTTAQQSGVYSKILSTRVSMGGEVSSGNESEGSTSSPVTSRAPAAPQGKTASRPGSALFWPPKPQVAPQEDASPPVAPPQVTPPQEITRKAGEGVEEGVEVEVSPLDIGAARRRFMSASFPSAPTAALGTSPPAVTPSPVTPTPSPPAPTPSPPAPIQSHPQPTNTTLGITSSILSRVGNTGLGMAPTHTPSPTPSPAPTHTPSFTVTVRTQPPPTLAPETPTPPASDGGKGGEPVQGQTSTEDWRVLVRQRREGRLKQTKTPDSEEIIIETRPPVSRNSKVLEMASNFQKLQVA